MNHYIRSGASGSNDGSSWANAWTTFGTVVWTRGDTYFLAGGDYNENVSLTKALSGALYITVKKANASDNSGDAGWNASFASTQAIINGTLDLDNGYWSIDGVTGGGVTGHGIKVNNASFSSHTLALASDTGPYKLSYLEAKGPGFTGSMLARDGIIYNNTTVSQKGLHIHHCWIHDVTRNGITLGGIVGTSFSDYGMLYEDNVLSETGGCLDPDQHGQGFQISFATPDAFLIFQRNVFSNISGTGMIVWLGGSGSVHSDARIINNIFMCTNGATYSTLSPGVIYARDGADSTDRIYVANNTFYGLTGLGDLLAQCVIDTEGTTGNVLYNNIFENCYFSATHRGFTQSNNGYFNNTGAGVPSGTTNQINGMTTAFSNAAAGNFNLVSGYAVGAGLDLSAIFTDDFTGAQRTAPYDIGAYKFKAETRNISCQNLVVGTLIVA